MFCFCFRKLFSLDILFKVDKVDVSVLLRCWPTVFSLVLCLTRNLQLLYICSIAYKLSFFFSCFWHFLFITGLSNMMMIMHFGALLFMFLCLGLLTWDMWLHNFHQIWKKNVIISLNIVSVPLLTLILKGLKLHIY